MKHNKIYILEVSPCPHSSVLSPEDTWEQEGWWRLSHSSPPCSSLTVYGRSTHLQLQGGLWFAQTSRYNPSPFAAVPGSQMQPVQSVKTFIFPVSTATRRWPCGQFWPMRCKQNYRWDLKKVFTMVWIFCLLLLLIKKGQTQLAFSLSVPFFPLGARMWCQRSSHLATGKQKSTRWRWWGRKPERGCSEHTTPWHSFTPVHLSLGTR